MQSYSSRKDLFSWVMPCTALWWYPSLQYMCALWCPFQYLPTDRVSEDLAFSQSRLVVHRCVNDTAFALWQTLTRPLLLREKWRWLRIGSKYQFSIVSLRITLLFECLVSKLPSSAQVKVVDAISVWKVIVISHSTNNHAHFCMKSFVGALLANGKHFWI